MSKRKKRIVIFLLSCIVMLSGFALWVLWGNTALEVNEFILEADRIPKSFDGYRIAQVSDFHNTQIGDRNERLLSALKESEADIIVITGDIIDWRSTDLDITADFVGQALKIAPCYYITGNNESYVDEKYDIKSLMEQSGVTVLDDKAQEIYVKDEKILLVGVDDPAYSKCYSLVDCEALIGDKLDKLIDRDCYNLLLSHRPELFELYCEKGADLVFSGHAHGGQFRIPFIGGVYAPDQGFFPEYDSGLYTEGGTNMIVSRGIGNSKIPVRINNRPEVVVVELKAE